MFDFAQSDLWTIALEFDRDQGDKASETHTKIKFMWDFSMRDDSLRQDIPEELAFDPEIDAAQYRASSVENHLKVV